MLFKYFTYHRWNNDDLPLVDNFIRYTGQLFFGFGNIEKYNSDSAFIGRRSPIINDPVNCHLQSFLLDLIGDILFLEAIATNTQELAIMETLEPAISFMDANFRNNPTLGEIAEVAYYAPNYFQKLFKDNFGISPFQYMLDKRLAEARRLLCTTNMSVKKVANQCGYENEFYFSRIFKKNLEISPSALRKKDSNI